MSEYTRRIIAFSAVAIVLALSISVGIVLLPQAAKSTSETTEATQTATLTFVTTAYVTQSQSSSLTQAGTTVTTFMTTVASLTTISSSSSVANLNSTISSGTVTGTTSSISCVVSGYPDGIYLKILTNSGAPIAGLNVSGHATYSVNGGSCSNSVFASTNSTGWASLGSNPGYYYVSFSYNGASYNLTIPSRPVTESIATYYVPSGNLTVSYCVYGNMSDCSS